MWAPFSDLRPPHSYQLLSGTLEYSHVIGARQISEQVRGADYAGNANPDILWLERMPTKTVCFLWAVLRRQKMITLPK